MVVRHEAQIPVFSYQSVNLLWFQGKISLELLMELENNSLPKFVWNHKEPKVSETALNSRWD